MKNQLQAGVARIDITPPVGISMAGYYAREGVSTGVERPLTATALVLANDDAKIAIVACDLVFIQSPEVDQMRRDIAGAIGTDAGSVLMNFSHTHCGPTPPSWGVWQGERQIAMQKLYMAGLGPLLTGCAAMANHRLAPARAGFGAGSVKIGINRRERDSDGKIFLGENPDGPMDPEVGVLRVDRRDGSPLAVLFSYGCHTVTMGPKNLRLTPDFPGPARELIEQATGATALYLQAAAGDINPITGIGATEDDTENMTRLGQMLGAEVVKTMAQVRTHQKRGPRGLFSSLSKNSLFPYVAVEDQPTEIAAVSKTFELPLLPFPSREDARQILAQRRQNLEKAQKDGAPGGLLTVLHRFHDWAKKMNAQVEAGVKQMSAPANFQAIRIGDCAIAAVSGETLVELGLAVKKDSPFSRTIFLGYSNGCVSYMPPAHAYPEGGWSPWETYSIPDMLFQTYQLPMPLEPGCGQRIADHSLGLLRSLVDEGAKSQAGASGS
ncbi:MAG: hypothetical protein FJW37_05930 [Acidobacteria bacterium]|nr:hypothetical protein [Acidobacteriota bacterium]